MQKLVPKAGFEPHGLSTTDPELQRLPVPPHFGCKCYIIFLRCDAVTVGDLDYGRKDKQNGLHNFIGLALGYLLLVGFVYIRQGGMVYYYPTKV